MLAIFSALALGWWFRGFTLENYQQQLAERYENRSKVDRVLSRATWLNHMVSVSRMESRMDPTERDRRTQNALIRNVSDLSRLEPIHTGNADGVFQMHGSNSLSHLGVSSATQLRAIVQDATITDLAKRPFLDKSHKDYNRLDAFITFCLAYDPNNSFSQ